MTNTCMLTCTILLQGDFQNTIAHANTSKLCRCCLGRPCPHRGEVADISAIADVKGVCSIWEQYIAPEICIDVCGCWEEVQLGRTRIAAADGTGQACGVRKGLTAALWNIAWYVKRSHLQALRWSQSAGSSPTRDYICLQATVSRQESTTYHSAHFLHQKAMQNMRYECIALPSGQTEHNLSTSPFPPHLHSRPVAPVQRPGSPSYT